MKLNEWEKQFSDPGPMPPVPPEYPRGQGIEAMNAWHDASAVYNKWVLANRRFMVARGCDRLEAKQAARLAAEGASATMEAVEIICLVLGVNYLQGGEHAAGPADLFGLLFGGHRS